MITQKPELAYLIEVIVRTSRGGLVGHGLGFGAGGLQVQKPDSTEDAACMGGLLARQSHTYWPNVLPCCGVKLGVGCQLRCRPARLTLRKNMRSVSQ
ncbi:hypothetical protein AVEN_213109-1 [Araneus ventricosus]|uniref:Uncharacterized protein n=1 Tax=Araneus ventricosus TaxID=182803 RepID=A0A4Y2JXA7_ARAVE|nr:hypothetical protein AVEN_213109-1 [Araneus ventricosus]